jgi:uncharacterized integral membrane protein (TIGR00698 family)
MEYLLKLSRGIGCTLAIALFSVLITQISWLHALQISPLIIAIVLGILIGNLVHHRIPDTWHPGILFSQRTLLRLGIILFGFQISWQEIARVGFNSVLVSLIIVISTLTIGYYIGRKLLKLDRETTLLTSMGSSICGAAAIMATNSVMQAKTHQVSIAVATVVIFGTIAMFIYPLLTHWLGLDNTTSGIYTGATIHEVAQVVAAGNAVSAETGQVAVIVKLTRVMMLAPAVIIIGWCLNRQTDTKTATPFSQLIPWFAIGFILTAGFNSLALLPPTIIHWINQLDIILLSMAMAALGFETQLSKVRHVGAKPFILAFSLFIYLLIGGYAIIRLLC